VEAVENYIAEIKRNDNEAIDISDIPF
jgi:hypothetical protein